MGVLLYICCIFSEHLFLRTRVKGCFCSSYEGLLAKDKSFTFHQRNINSLAIKQFKVKRNLSTVITCNVLKTRTLTHNLRSQTDFVSDCVNTRRYGLNLLSYFASKVWDMIHCERENKNSFQKFETEIRKKGSGKLFFLSLSAIHTDFLIWFKLLFCLCKLSIFIDW